VQALEGGEREDGFGQAPGGCGWGVRLGLYGQRMGSSCLSMGMRSANGGTWTPCNWRRLSTHRCPGWSYPDGKTACVRVPWAERYSRLSRMMEAWVIQVLRSASSVSKAAELLHLSWDVVDGVMKRAVERGLLRREKEPIQHLGIDEKSISQGHHYATVISDLDDRRAWEVMERRDGSSADAAMASLSPEQREAVEAVAMDMWPAYMRAAADALPHARVVHDKFHIAKYLNEAVDKVRRKENSQLLTKGDTRLKGSKYLWLRGFKDLRSTDARSFRKLYAAALKTSRAWALKESLPPSGITAIPRQHGSSSRHGKSRPCSAGLIPCARWPKCFPIICPGCSTIAPIPSPTPPAKDSIAELPPSSPMLGAFAASKACATVFSFTAVSLISCPIYPHGSSTEKPEEPKFEILPTDDAQLNSTHNSSLPYAYSNHCWCSTAVY